MVTAVMKKKAKVADSRESDALSNEESSVINIYKYREIYKIL
jgi:hypothetical protein